MKKLLCSVIMLVAYAHCANTNQPISGSASTRIRSHLIIGSPMKPAGIDAATGQPYYINQGRKILLPKRQQQANLPQ